MKKACEWLEFIHMLFFMDEIIAFSLNRYLHLRNKRSCIHYFKQNSTLEKTLEKVYQKEIKSDCYLLILELPHVKILPPKRKP